jgi:hypothetical protein
MLYSLNPPRVQNSALYLIPCTACCWNHCGDYQESSIRKRFALRRWMGSIIQRCLCHHLLSIESKFSALSLQWIHTPKVAINFATRCYDSIQTWLVWVESNLASHSELWRINSKRGGTLWSVMIRSKATDDQRPIVQLVGRAILRFFDLHVEESQVNKETTVTSQKLPYWSAVLQENGVRGFVKFGWTLPLTASWKDRLW